MPGIMKEKMRTGKSDFLRIIIYLAIGLVCLLAVSAAIRMVDEKRSAKIISFISEWSDRGRPVTTRKVEASDIPVYTKITLILKQDKTVAGFVTADIKDKLKKGQEVYLREGAAACGKVSDMDRDMDTHTGMYKVSVEFGSPVASPGAMIPVFVLSGELKDAIVVPNSVVDISGGNYSLWKIEEGRAKKSRIEIGRRDGYGTVIEKGLRSGDEVVYTGQSILKEGDKVDIIGGGNLPGSNKDSGDMKQ